MTAFLLVTWVFDVTVRPNVVINISNTIASLRPHPGSRWRISEYGGDSEPDHKHCRYIVAKRQETVKEERCNVHIDGASFPKNARVLCEQPWGRSFGATDQTSHVMRNGLHTVDLAICLRPGRRFPFVAALKPKISLGLPHWSCGFFSLGTHPIQMRWR